MSLSLHRSKISAKFTSTYSKPAIGLHFCVLIIFYMKFGLNWGCLRNETTCFYPSMCGRLQIITCFKSRKSNSWLVLIIFYMKSSRKLGCLRNDTPKNRLRLIIKLQYWKLKAAEGPKILGIDVLCWPPALLNIYVNLTKQFASIHHYQIHLIDKQSQYKWNLCISLHKYQMHIHILDC